MIYLLSKIFSDNLNKLPALYTDMPGAHTYLQYILTLQFYTKPWPRIMDSAGKRAKSQSQKREPAHGPPLQARVVAANRAVCTTLKR